MKFLLVEDHQIIREVLSRYIKENITVNLDQANNGVEAMHLIKLNQYDLIITDINMPRMDGIELMKEIRVYDPDLKVIALSMMDDNASIKKMLKAGVNGYVLKEGNTAELKKAIDNVLKNEKYYSPTVQDTIIEGVIKGNNKFSSMTPLSKRELEVLRLVFEEKSNGEIGEELFISVRTVEAHKHRIMEKTGSRNMAGLVKYAIRNKLYDDLFY